MGNFSNPDALGDLPLSNGRVSVDAQELADTRFAASQFLPYKEEATRLADALHNVDPDHPLLRGELWQEFIAEKVRRGQEDQGIEPSPIGGALENGE